MGQVGANPEDLRRAAGLMASAAQRLEGISRQLTAMLMASPWSGPVADGFRTDWNRHHRGELAAAGGFLRHGHDTLRANADQQERTSASEGGIRLGGMWSAAQMDAVLGLTLPAGVLALLGSMGRAWQNSGFGLWWSGADRAQGLLGFISRNASVAGRYTDAWRTVIRRGPAWGIPSSWLRFKSSPVLQGLHQVLNPAEGVFRGTGKVFDALGPAGLALSLFGNADRFGSSLGRGDNFSAGVAVTESTADVLKTSKNPVAYFGGAAVQSWTEVAKAVKDNADAGNFTAEEWNRATHAGWRVWGGAVADAVTKSLPGMAARIFL